MFITDITNVEFKKIKEEKKKEDSKVLRNAKGVALAGTSGAIGVQSLRSGLPRLVGARLEQHGTSKASAKKIIESGFLDPAYGGSEGGVTASLMLPKSFLERAKGYTFLSGKNSNHPFYKNRIPVVSDIGDVITRKIQVLGYRGSKAGKITPDDVEKGSKFLANQVSNLTKSLDLKTLTKEEFLSRMEQASKKDDFYKEYYNQIKNDPIKLSKDLKDTNKETNKILKRIKDISKRGYKDKDRVKGIKKTQKKYKELLSGYLDEIKNNKNTTSNIREYGTDKLLTQQMNENKLKELLESKIQEGDKKAARILKLKDALDNQIQTQKTAKTLGLGAAWTKKLTTSPALGALGVGKTVYLPGTDKYFNDTDRFKYDIDDPFGNPLKYGKAMSSEKGGMGGNALKTKEKVRAFGNRFDATMHLLKQEGDGNIFKGAGKLIKANPKRALAGAAILGTGGAISTLLGKKAIDKFKNNEPQKRLVKVKSTVRNGKIVKGFNRLNPFYDKLKQKDK